jgi:two-component sensor histidine kinase
VPTRTGFGSRLIHTALTGSGGDAQIDYATEGLQCALTIALIEKTDEAPAAIHREKI